MAAGEIGGEVVEVVEMMEVPETGNLGSGDTPHVSGGGRGGRFACLPFA